MIRAPRDGNEEGWGEELKAMQSNITKNTTTIK